MLAAGLVAQVMLLAAGCDLGGPSTAYSATLTDGFVAESQAILADYGDKVVLPSDLADVSGRVARSPWPIFRSTSAPRPRTRTVKTYRRCLRGPERCSSTVLRRVREARDGVRHQSIVGGHGEVRAYTALGGGDSIAAMNKYELGESFDYVCTAGGGMVKF